MLRRVLDGIDEPGATGGVRDDQLAVLGPSHAKRRRTAGEGLHRRSCQQIPDVDRVTPRVRERGHATAGAIDARIEDALDRDLSARFQRQRDNVLGVGVPYPQVTVPVPGDDLRSTGTRGHGGHVGAMAMQLGRDAAVSGIPGDQPSVRAGDDQADASGNER